MAELNMTLHRLAERPDCALVRMVGALDPTTVVYFEDQLKQYEQAGVLHLGLDFAAIKYCNCTGLGSLVANADHFPKVGRQLLLFDLHPKVRVVFEMIGLMQYFRVVSGEAAARAELLAAPRPQPDPGPQARLDIPHCNPGPVTEAALAGAVKTSDLPAFDRRLKLVRTPITRFLLLDVSGLSSLDAQAQAWLVQWAGEMVRRGGCVALAGLSDELAQRLQQAEAYGAFEHYPDAAAARRSLQAVVAKEPAWVLGAWRYFPQRTITLALGESLPEAAEKQLKGYVDDLLAEPWVQYAVFDASRTRTLAPAAELQLTRVAEAMKQRRGLMIVAGATPGLRRAMDTKGLYHWAETETGAREFIEEEFISRSG